MFSRITSAGTSGPYQSMRRMNSSISSFGVMRRAPRARLRWVTVGVGSYARGWLESQSEGQPACTSDAPHSGGRDKVSFMR